ncbi:tail fiber domain-containing protein [Afipia carboxidovorans]|uniref:tail fiber domain-containing protein n=1 Tax=Afipia carboxidovorans TaxID=40137 RepID=UPI0030D073AF
MNNVNQVGPNGSINYSQSGTYKFTDPYTGQSYDIPQFTQTTTLSPEQQALYDLNNQTQQNLGQIGVSQSAKIGDLLNTPFDPATANKTVEDKITSLGAARLDPRFEREADALATRLSNQGIMPGSAAWKAQMDQFQQGKNDAYNQLYLSGNQQAFQQAITERNQPINEITALLSGSQVSNPTFGATPQTTIPTTDTAGIINSNYAQQQQNYQTQLQQQNALMGGLFGLGAAGVYKFSDERLKDDVKKVGETDEGIGLYSYKYKGADQHELGLIAQDVEKKKPSAVKKTKSGFKAVDYSKALGLMDSA